MSQSSIDAISVLRNQSLATIVQHEVERLILSGEFNASKRLEEGTIAKRFNVSRGPVREAFRALSQEGLVCIEKNRGVSVRRVSVDEADEMYELRAWLDKLIGQLAAENMSDPQREELKELLDELRDAASKRDVNVYYPVDSKFHDQLAIFTGNNTLLAAYRRVVKGLHLFRRQTLELGQDSFNISVREHADIVDALLRRQSEKAGRLLYAHAVASRERLHDTLSPQPSQEVALQPATPINPLSDPIS